MRDLMSIRSGVVKARDGKVIPVARIKRIPANKYSARYMALAKKVGP